MTKDNHDFDPARFDKDRASGYGERVRRVIPVTTRSMISASDDRRKHAKRWAYPGRRLWDRRGDHPPWAWPASGDSWASIRRAIC